MKGGNYELSGRVNEGLYAGVKGGNYEPSGRVNEGVYAGMKGGNYEPSSRVNEGLYVGMKGGNYEPSGHVNEGLYADMKGGNYEWQHCVTYSEPVYAGGPELQFTDRARMPVTGAGITNHKLSRVLRIACMQTAILLVSLCNGKANFYVVDRQ